MKNLIRTLGVTAGLALAVACEGGGDSSLANGDQPLTPSTFESADGNLVVNVPGARDWANAPNLVLQPDLPSGHDDNAFGQGSKEDIPNPTVVTGGIPPNKDNLTRLLVAHEQVSGDEFLYLAWTRAAAQGTANVSFELNQSSTLDANGVTPVRTAGDILITYDFSQGGKKPSIAVLRWLTSGSDDACFSAHSLPCWGNRQDLSDVSFADGAVNTTDVVNPFGNPDTLAPFTFGEAAIDLTATGIFGSQCTRFVNVLVKSRASVSFTSELKDFIAPVSVNISNCGTVNVHKTDAACPSSDSCTPLALAGAQFQLFDGVPNGTSCTGNAVDSKSCTTDASGLCSIGGITFGTYCLAETVAPTGFQLANAVAVTVNADNATVAASFSEPRTVVQQELGTISVTKLDGGCPSVDAGMMDCDNNNCPPLSLAGAVFQLFTGSPSGTGCSGSAVDSFSCTTDASGTCTLGTTIPLGSYCVAETTAPTGFSLANAVSVTINEGNPTANVSLTEPRSVVQQELGSISVTKLDGGCPSVDAGVDSGVDYRWYTTCPTLSLAGAVFQLFTGSPSGTGCSGSAVDSFSCTTDASGTCTLGTTIPLGTYCVAETAAPTGFSLANAVSVTINEGNPTANVSLTEPRSVVQLQLGSITITKQDATCPPVDPTVISFRWFDLCPPLSLAGATFQLFTGDPEGTSCTGAAVDAFLCTTDSSGTCSLGDTIPLGTYCVEETMAPNGFLVANAQSVTINAASPSGNATFSEVRKNGTGGHSDTGSDTGVDVGTDTGLEQEADVGVYDLDTGYGIGDVGTQQGSPGGGSSGCGCTTSGSTGPSVLVMMTLLGLTSFARIRRKSGRVS